LLAGDVSMLADTFQGLAGVFGGSTGGGGGGGAPGTSPTAGQSSADVIY